MKLENPNQTGPSPAVTVAPEYGELVERMGFAEVMSTILAQRLSDRGPTAKLLALHLTSEEFKRKIAAACARSVAVNLSLAEARAITAHLKSPLLKRFAEIEPQVTAAMQPELAAIFGELERKLAAL